MTEDTCDALALFSGGLDSILAAKVIAGQGLRVKCLHFFSPFFGHPDRVGHWRKTYGLDIDKVDIGADFCTMMATGPAHGFGSVLNPCIDCKILLLRAAGKMLAHYGASFIITGEVVGQRPMSQRADAMNAIRREAGAKEFLLRPLSARLLEPTPMELSGLVNRDLLFGFSGRGRKNQLELAERLGIAEIPTPAGGCMLTERENARRYWPVMKYVPDYSEADFYLANTGRQYWAFSGDKPFWLSIGRNMADNENLLSRARPDDLLFKVEGHPGPLAVGRNVAIWPDEVMDSAASFMASFSPRAVRGGSDVVVTMKSLNGSLCRQTRILPERKSDLGWREFVWEETRDEIRKTRISS